MTKWKNLASEETVIQVELSSSENSEHPEIQNLCCMLARGCGQSTSALTL